MSTIVWKRATIVPPLYVEPTSILVAFPSIDGEPPIALGFANADFNGVRMESTGEAPDGDGWFWIAEDELLAGLPVAGDGGVLDGTNRTTSGWIGQP